MPAIHQPGLFFVEFQPSRGQPFSQPLAQHLPLSRLAQDDKIIRISHQDWLAFDLFVDRPIQRVEVEIGQQWRNDPSLRRAAGVGFDSSRAVLVLFLHRRPQPHFDEPQDTAIADSSRH